jgi:hypothetical protein
LSNVGRVSGERAIMLLTKFCEERDVSEWERVEVKTNIIYAHAYPPLLLRRVAHRG